MMIKIQQVTFFGQLKAGDMILVETKQDGVFAATVKDVINGSRPDEEIILSKGRNLYFITKMLINDESWAVECHKVFNGKMYSVGNTTDVLPS